MPEYLRCLLEGPLGIGASTLVGDGRDLCIEQRTLMLVRVAAGDIVHPGLHVVLGGEGDNGHSGGRRYHWEIREELLDEPELADEVGMAHAGRLVHQEDHVQVAALVPQPPDVLLEGLAQLLHFVLCAL